MHEAATSGIERLAVLRRGVHPLMAMPTASIRYRESVRAGTHAASPETDERCGDDTVRDDAGEGARDSLVDIEIDIDADFQLDIDISAHE
jgi:hypothetical protein